MKRLFVSLMLFAGCSNSAPPAPMLAPTQSSTLALTADDRSLWAVNQDADSVSLLDTSSRALVTEVALGPAPVADPTTMRYEPALKPRALALTPDGKKLYVAAQTANRVFVIDTASRAVSTSIPVPAAPTAVVVSPDGGHVYVVSHEAAVVTAIDPKSDTVAGSLPVAQHPWGASVSGDSRTLYVTQFLLGPGVTLIDTGSFSVRGFVPLAEQVPQPGADKRVPNGVARGLYAAVPRPGSGELWVPHMLLAVKTPEPALDFESTVFPTISTIVPDGSAEGHRMLFQPSDPPGVSGAFTDVISGPRALAFTPDGKYAVLADSQSEDVMIFDATRQVEVGLLRPIPGAFLEGVAIDHAGANAYVEGRNTHNVTVVALTPTDATSPAHVVGDPIDRLGGADPMPATLREGQRLFYTSNSSMFPVTSNFWVACASCHLEGGTDAVTWLFTVGPRDTPSNAGGPINTGFLLRQALRSTILDYDTTINIEQGGAYHRTSAAQLPQLQALSDFVNYAIPFPQNPNLAADGTLTSSQQHGQTIFQQACASCHSGAYLTDSGAGNPTLDLKGTIVLHDIGTCVTNGAFDDQPAPDDEFGLMHTACDFDTPTLRGIFATPPYLHDGSAMTLEDAVARIPFAASLSSSDQADLVAYLKTL